MLLVGAAVSADMAHAMHPSQACAAGQEDSFHQPKLHDGLVIKHDAVHSNATDIFTSYLFREIAKRNCIPTQVCYSWQQPITLFTESYACKRRALR